MTRKMQKEFRRCMSPFFFLFPAVMFYYELVFRISTTGDFTVLNTTYLLLLSVQYGIVAFLLCSLFKNVTVNRVLTSLFLAITPILYLVQYFVYRYFNIFYDVNTVVGGAEGVATGFADEIKNLIFSVSGILNILLFFLPFLLYLIFGNKIGKVERIRKIPLCISGISLLSAFLLCLILIFTSNIYRPIFTEEYRYQSAVSNFGLLTGTGLDIQKSIFATKETFQFEAEELASELVSEPEPSTEESPVVYGYNKMDIDFEALSENASEVLSQLDQYVLSLEPSRQSEYTGLFEGKNLILITAEAFSAEVIDPVLTPTLYRLATKGMQFTDYYQAAGAGTTGGEYQILMGMLPTAGGMSMKNTANHLNYLTIANQLNRLNYYGKAFHNNSYTYYDRHLTHPNLGFSDGFMGYGNGMEEYVTQAWPQSDLEMFAGTIPTYIDKQPFSIYYMTVSGHSGYSITGNRMSQKNWDRVAHLEGSDVYKSYIAANLELEDALATLVKALEDAGIADDTVICLSADHFPYGLDNGASLGNMPYLSELYGEEVTNSFQRDHNRLILWCGSLEDEAPIIVDTPTSSLDILPTLSNLFGVEYDSRLLPGRDVFSDAEALVFNLNYDWKTELGTYFADTDTFLPTDQNTEVPEKYIERMKATVRNKIRFCKGVLDTDYYAHVFEDEKS